VKNEVLGQIIHNADEITELKKHTDELDEKVRGEGYDR
jgi:tetrahydromethanopterin S-methyltransferase subunit G